MTRQTSVQESLLGPGRSRDRLSRRRLEMERLENRWALAASVSGQVVHDVNEDGVVDPDDPGLAGVRVYLDENANEMLDIVGSYIEPDDYDPGQDLSNVLPGVTLSLADLDNTPTPSRPIEAVLDSQGLATTGDQVFGYGSVDFFEPAARLRIDFASPVSSVAIDFAGSRPFAGEVGTLHIYDAQDQPLGSIDSPELAKSEWATLSVSRAEVDIAYAVAYTKVAEGGGTGRFDALRINSEGSESWTVTDADGNYELIGLDAGTHRVREVVPVGYRQTFPGGDGSHEVTLAADQVLTDIDFANRASMSPTAVDDGPRFTAMNTPVKIDVLTNDLEGDNPLDPTTVTIAIDPAHGTASADPVTGEVLYSPDMDFTGSDEFRYEVRDAEDLVSNEATVTVRVGELAPWQNQDNPLDVDNDGGVYPIDVLLVINELNEPEYRNPITGWLPPPPDPVPFYFDVSGDNYAVPNDANLIITYLNSVAVGAVPLAATPVEVPAAEAEPSSRPGADVAAALAKSVCSATEFSVATVAGVSEPVAAPNSPRFGPEPLPSERSVMFDASAGTDPSDAALESVVDLDDDLLSALAQDVAAIG